MIRRPPRSTLFPYTNALPICQPPQWPQKNILRLPAHRSSGEAMSVLVKQDNCEERDDRWADRKSTRLNSSHQIISYAVFCLKKKKSRQYEAWSNYHISAQ